MVKSIPGELNIELMQEGAALFKGQHNFVRYCTKPTKDTNFNRELLVSEIRPNTLYTANFFPKQSFAYHISSKGFMRYQVRLIMGQLFSLGKGEITLSDIKESLEGNDKSPLRNIALGSGLILYNTEFED